MNYFLRYSILQTSALGRAYVVKGDTTGKKPKFSFEPYFELLTSYISAYALQYILNLALIHNTCSPKLIFKIISNI